MRLSDRKIGFFLLILCTLVWLEAWSYPFTSKVLPLVLVSLMAVLGLILVFRGGCFSKPIAIRQLLPYTLILLGAIIIMDLVGFFVAVVFLVSGGMLVQGQRRPKSILLNLIVFCLISYVFFIKLLALPLPRVWNQ